MDDFKRWLDEEIKHLEAEQSEHNLFVWGKYSEAVRIRAMMRRMDAERKKDEGEIL